MARQFIVQGETLVQVKGHANSSISSLTNLGVSDSPIVVTLTGKHDDIITDPTGSMVPCDIQTFVGEASIVFTMIHYDRAVLDTLYALSVGGTAPGTMGRAGQIMGNGLARLASGWLFVGMNLTGPVAGSGWNFKACYLADSYSMPLGTERSATRATFRAIPYVADPASGSALAVLWNTTLDT